MWSDKKKKHMLPFASEAPLPPPTATPPPYNPLAEKYAPSDDEGLKNYAIVYLDREVAQSRGDPIITVIQAHSQAEAELQASEMNRNGFEVLAVQSNETVVYPTHDSGFVFPRSPEAQEPGSGEEESAEGGEILRRRRKRRSDY